MSNIIQIKKLSKHYQDGAEKIVALDKVSFSLKKGEDLVIVGPSGSGKTTLLEIMAGLNTPTSGNVLIDGNDVHKGSDEEISQFRNKSIGFVFQMMHLQEYFSALENVITPLIAGGVPRDESLKRAEELLVKVGLKDRMTQYPKQLSGGEMQRVAIARALSNNPKLIMADEPTGKLDKRNADKILQLFDDISKEKDMSVIMITHDLSIAKLYKNNLKLDHGKAIN